MHPILRPDCNRGFTLVEMLGVLTLSIALGSLGLATALRPSPRAEARAVALEVRARLVDALASAAADEVDVVIRAEPAGARAGARFTVVSGAADPDHTPAGDGVLLDGVVWGGEGGVPDPLGAPAQGPPGTLRCSAWSCDTGTADHVTYRIGHSRSARAGWAVVLTRERDVALFRWDATTRGWVGGA